MWNIFYISRKPLSYSFLVSIGYLITGIIGVITLGKVGCSINVEISRILTKREFQKMKNARHINNSLTKG
jgi:hypothetical protein